MGHYSCFRGIQGAFALANKGITQIIEKREMTLAEANKYWDENNAEAMNARAAKKPQDLARNPLAIFEKLQWVRSNGEITDEVKTKRLRHLQEILDGGVIVTAPLTKDVKVVPEKFYSNITPTAKHYLTQAC